MRTGTLLLLVVFLSTLLPERSFALQLAPGMAAPPWQLKNLDGQTVQLSDFKGKVVLLDFWAAWYAPCRTEISELAALQKQDKEKGLVVVGVSVDDGGPGAVSKFLKSHPDIDYPILIGDDTVRMEYGGIECIPTTFVINRDGVIANIHPGPTSQETLKKELGKLL